MRNGMTCPKDRGGCGKPMAWDDGAFCRECMTKTLYERLKNMGVESVDDRDEYPGGYSDYGSHQQSFNRRGGCST